MEVAMRKHKVMTASGWATFAMVATVVIAAVMAASAQPPLDAAMVVGKWWGTTRRPGGGATLQVEFKPGGIFEGGSNSAEFGQVQFTNGHWGLDDDAMRVDYTVTTSRGTTESSCTLKRDGERLLGSGRNRTTNATFDIDLKRMK
jgi:hypothetical protein